MGLQSAQTVAEGPLDCLFGLLLEDGFGLDERLEGGGLALLEGEVGAFGEFQLAMLGADIEWGALNHFANKIY